MKVWSWNTVSTMRRVCIGQSRLQEVLREDASIGQPPVRYGSGLRESKEEGRESEVR